METATKLPIFEGSKIEIPYNFLSGAFGEAVHKEVLGRYKGMQAIENITYKENIVQGSNPFYVVAVNEVIRQEGLRTATPRDIETILESNALELRGQYEDLALVLRNDQAPNEYVAKNLLQQIQHRNGKRTKLPVMISLSNLSLEKDSKAPEGLVFELNEDAEIIYSDKLNYSPQNRFTTTDVYGLPNFNKEGTRTWYTRGSGLSWVCLGRDLDSYSEGNVLARSNESGRVVVVRGEGAVQNFADYVKLLNSEMEKQQRKLDKKFEDALRVLRD